MGQLSHSPWIPNPAQVNADEIESKHVRLTGSLLCETPQAVEEARFWGLVAARHRLSSMGAPSDALSLDRPSARHTYSIWLKQHDNRPILQIDRVGRRPGCAPGC